MEGLAIPFEKLKECLDSIINFFKQVISYINPFSENFFVYKLIELLGSLLKFLFVPTENSFNSIQEKINTRFYFLNQIKELFFNLIGYNNYGSELPIFSINYYGQTVNIIDFSLFTNYRIWLHGIILAVAWFYYLRKLYNNLPRIIGGV